MGFFDSRIRHFDTSQNWFGYILDTFQCAPALCLEAVPEGCPSANPSLRFFHPYPPPILAFFWAKKSEDPPKRTRNFLSAEPWKAMEKIVKRRKKKRGKRKNARIGRLGQFSQDFHFLLQDPRTPEGFQKGSLKGCL